MLIYFIQASQEARHQELRHQIEAQANTIDPDLSQEFKEQIFDLLKDHPNDNIDLVIRAWKTVPVSERTEVFIDQIHKLTRNHPKASIGFVIKAWKEVLQEQRNDIFINQIHALTQNHPNVEIDGMISCLKWFAPTDRDTVMELYNRITSFNEYPDWDQLKRIAEGNRIAYLRRIADQLSSDFPQGRTKANADAIEQRIDILFETPFDEPFPSYNNTDS